MVLAEENKRNRKQYDRHPLQCVRERTSRRLPQDRHSAMVAQSTPSNPTERLPFIIVVYRSPHKRTVPNYYIQFQSAFNSRKTETYIGYEMSEDVCDVLKRAERERVCARDGCGIPTDGEGVSICCV